MGPLGDTFRSPCQLPALTHRSRHRPPGPASRSSPQERPRSIYDTSVCTFTETCGVPGSLPGQTQQEGGRHTRSAGEEDGRDPRRNETTPASGRRSEGTRGVRDGPR